MKNATTQTFENYNSDSHAEHSEQKEKRSALLKKVGAGALAIAAAAGLKGLMDMPSDMDASGVPKDTSFTQVTLVEGAKIRSNPGINELPDDPEANVIGSIENKSDAANDAITLPTPDGIRIHENVTAQDGKSVFYGFSFDELKKAGIKLSNKDTDKIGWVEKSQVTDIVKDETTEP